MSDKGLEFSSHIPGEDRLDPFSIYNAPSPEIRAFITKCYRMGDTERLNQLIQLIVLRQDALSDEDGVLSDELDIVLDRAVAARTALDAEIDDLESLLPERWAADVISDSIATRLETDDETEQPPIDSFTIDQVRQLAITASEKMLTVLRYEADFTPTGEFIRMLEQDVARRLAMPALRASEEGLLLELRPLVEAGLESYSRALLDEPDESTSPLEN